MKGGEEQKGETTLNKCDHWKLMVNETTESAYGGQA